MGTPGEHHYIKRILLPSGKTIEVVYFRDADVAEPAVAEPSVAEPSVAEPSVAESRPATREAPRPDEGLHVCRACDSDLVHPTEWQEEKTRRWNVSLRCPNCEWTGSGVFEQDVVDRFDEELDRGTEALVADLKRLTRANMVDEVDRFVMALEADAIHPMDF